MSNRNIFFGVMAAGALRWQPYHFHVSIVLKSESLKLLEPSAPVQVCNGIALPLSLHFLSIYLTLRNVNEKSELSEIDNEKKWDFRNETFYAF